MPNTSPRILAILTVRNEGAFLIDWFAHHRAAGFTDFLVFSNDCDDGTDAMLDRMADLGWLVHVRNDSPHARGPQWDALRRADDHPLKAAADWVLPIDIDEYVNIHAGDRTVTALLAALPDATAIPLTWRFFGNGGLVRHRDRPVSGLFTRAAPPDLGWPWRAGLFKTLFRNDGTYARLGVHRPRQPVPGRIGAARWFDGSGRELPEIFLRQRIFSILGQNNYGLAQINHYALGAMDSYILKCDRGRANRGAATFDMSYWVERNFQTDSDTTIKALSPRSAPLRDALRADSTLMALHTEALAWRANRFDALMLDENFRALFGRLLLTPPSQPLNREMTAFLTGYAIRAARSAPASGGSHPNAQQTGGKDPD